VSRSPLAGPDGTGPAPTRSAPTRSRARAAATLSAVVLFAAGAWLARPIARATAAPTRPPLRAVLVDTSLSATATRPGWRAFAVRTLAEEARAAALAGEEILVVSYADVVARRFAPGPPAELSALLAGRDGVPFQPLAGGNGPGAGLGTDLAGALTVAADALAAYGRPPGRLVLVGEGTSTPESPGAAGLDAALARVAAHVVELRHVSLPPRTHGDLELRSLALPRAAPEGVPVALDLTLAWRRGADGLGPGPILVEVTQRGAAAPLLTTTFDPPSAGTAAPGAAQAPGAAAALTFDTRVVLAPLPRGVHELTVRARPARGADPLPHDDVHAATLEIGDVARVVAVVREGSTRLLLTAELGAGGAQHGLALTTVEPEDLERELVDADVLFTVGVQLAALPVDGVRAHIARGGGWLHAAGTEFLRVDGGALAGELALRPARDERPPREVLFFVDGSGSMQGVLWDRVRQALYEVVPEVRSEDTVVLRFFNRNLGPPRMRTASLEPEARLAELRRVLDADPEGGATDVLGALLDFLMEEERRGAVPTPDRGVIVLLTDGVSDSVDELAPDTRAALGALGFGLRVVHIGDDIDGLRFLERLLLPGERVLAGGALEGLAEQLRDELHDERFHPPCELSPARAAGGLAEKLARAAEGTLGRVARALRVELNPGAAAVLVTGAAGDGGPGGEPVLAVVDRGAGLVATLATLPRADWWEQLAARPAMLVPTLLALAERAAERAAPGELRARPDGTLELEDGDPRWPAELALVFSASAPIDPFGRPGARAELGRTVCTPAPLPGAPWRRSGTRPAGAAGAALVTLVDPISGAALRRWSLPAARPAEGTADERPVPHWPTPARGALARTVGPHPAAPWLIVSGALALLLVHLPRRAARSVFRRGGASPAREQPISPA
jgi:hypothetical protein